MVSNYVHGLKYAVVRMNGVLEWKRQYFLCTDGVCLIASSEEDMKVIMEQVKECVTESGLKANSKKSNVVCINGDVGKHVNLDGVHLQKEW